jgi:hypothetical protein
MPDAIQIVIEDDNDAVTVDAATGTVETRQPDGGVVVQLDAARPKKEGDDEDKWFANLADEIDANKLAIIANELHDAISADDRSRQGYLATRARGFDLLGIKLENPKSSVGDSSAPVEGMSSVTNPLLLEAVLKGWANAQAELLPANGPVKIRDDAEDESGQADELAEAFERDMNHYLTKTASEYYPDTSHMLLWGPYFGGSGFKKVNRCPMRRRPVSESVDAKDLIVSDTAKDLRSCARVTHEIPMRPSVMKRMKLIGAYRDVDLPQPAPPTTNQVDAKIAGVQGTTRSDRPEDQPYNLWETQCELDLDQFIPAGSKFKDEAIPLPYLVTMDKDSREILAIRRDWDKDDEECERQRMYVKYPYVPGPGFYGTGMLNILGNSSAAMTAAWREALDAGMFASFPGGLIAKLAGRQNTSNFRVAPGEFAAVETGGLDIRTVAMGMPYKDVSPGLMALIDKITAQSQQLGGSAEIPAAEGLANIPVGTMLAQIEQATKVMAAAHKGMHQAQSEEFELIQDLFRANPEDFWRNNKVCPKGYWNEQKFIQALDECDLVPVSDPNVPSHIHRVMKAIALLQLLLQPALAPFMSAKEVLLRCLRALKEDPNGLVVDPPPTPMGGPQADPAKMISAQAQMLKAQTEVGKAQNQAQQAGADTQIQAAKLQGEKEIAGLQLQREMVIHQSDAAHEARDQAHEAGVAAHQAQMDRGKLALDAQSAAHDQTMERAAHGLEVGKAHHEAALGVAQHRLDVHEALNPPKPATAKPKSPAQ